MVCEYCDSDFIPKHPRGRFCSAKCRTAAWHESRQAGLATIEAALSRALEAVRILRQAKSER
jgi:hypothetical protein